MFHRTLLSHPPSLGVRADTLSGVEATLDRMLGANNDDTGGDMDDLGEGSNDELASDASLPGVAIPGEGDDPNVSADLCSEPWRWS